MKAQQLTANIKNSGDGGFSNFGSPHWAFVSGDRNVIRNPLLSILATRYAQFGVRDLETNV
jgi:hypothetical protein